MGLQFSIQGLFGDGKFPEKKQQHCGVSPFFDGKSRYGKMAWLVICIVEHRMGFFEWKMVENPDGKMNGL